jgi:hypothetical protein
MTSQGKCVTHAQATLPRLRELTNGCIFLAGKVKWQVLSKDDSRLYGDYVLSMHAVNGFGSRSFYQEEIEEKFVILGHTPTLGDWLELLGAIKTLRYDCSKEGDMMLAVREGYTLKMMFNLATNEPATEKDWDTLAELLNL